MFGFYDKSFTFFGVNIAYYGLLIALGMGIGVFLACKNAKFRGLKSDDIIIIACYVLPLSIIGARIYYVLFSLDSFDNFWQVFEIWKGGMAIYGGVIGGAIGVTLYCLIHKKNFLDIADIVVPSLILGQAIGRWGNFINQEAYGNFISNPNAQWFPLGVYIESCHQSGCGCGGSGWHMATFFYESIWNFAVFAVLMILLRKNKLNLRGSMMCFYMILYGIGRTWIEAFRTDSLYLGSIRVSQLLSILLIVFGIGFIIVSYILNKKGKIKSLEQLENYYQLALKGKPDKNKVEKKDKKSLFKLSRKKENDIIENNFEENILENNSKEDFLKNHSEENYKTEDFAEKNNQEQNISENGKLSSENQYSLDKDKKQQDKEE